MKQKSPENQNKNIKEIKHPENVKNPKKFIKNLKLSKTYKN